MTDTQSERPPYLWAALTFAVILAIYIATLAPTTAFWDTSEYIAAAYSLGIPHPPGNPLFTVLAHTWGAIPWAASYAVRINLFAAVTSALAAGLWFLVAERWLRSIVTVRWARLAAAFAGTLVGATSWTVWNQSTVNAKVYTVSLLTLAFTLWLTVRWADNEPGPHRDRLLILIAYVVALSTTNHMMGALIVPVIGIYILMTDWRVLLRPGLLAAVVVAAGLGWSLNFMLLIRSAQYPPINEGEPTTVAALKAVLNREQYGKPSIFLRQADFPAQLGNYLQYFSWQFAGDCSRGFNASCLWFNKAATALFAVLGVGGIMALWARRRRAGIALVVLLFTFTIALVFYLNFKYGFSWHPERNLIREVRERDYFFVASFAAWGLAVALGLGALMRIIVDFLRDRGTPTSRWAAASPVLALALIPIFGNHITASRAHETLARDFAADMLQSVEPYGILITAGDNDTFPLWYAQTVEGIRPDVTLVNLSLANTDWHLRQLRRRETPAFNPAEAPDLWKPRPAEPQRQLTDTGAVVAQGEQWPKPTSPVFSLTQDQLDQIPPISLAPSSGKSQFGNVTITYGNRELEKSDVAVALLIKDNLGKRPIYFAWSDGGYPDQTLGLAPYLVTQGMVRKLNNGLVQPVDDSIVVSRGFGYVDLPTTEKLLWDVYHWKSATRERPRGWVDEPSSPILRLYGIVYQLMGNTLLAQGDTVQAMRADSVSRSVYQNLEYRTGH